MGMDVYGKEPDSRAGEYFRASIWSWRPIYSLILEICYDLLDEKALRGMAYNDGAGANDATTCVQMAGRFEQWLKLNCNGHQVYVEKEAVIEGSALKAMQKAGLPTPNYTEANYCVSDERLIAWVEFLRHCGGFEVW